MPPPAVPLVHYYACEESPPQDLRDSCSARTHLPQTGSPRTAVGKIGRCRGREAADGVMRFFLPSNLIAAPRFTVAYWGRFKATDGWSFGLGRLAVLWDAATQSLKLWVHGVFTDLGPWSADVWHHLAVAYDDALGAWDAYIDGALVASGTAPPGVMWASVQGTGVLCSSAGNGMTGYVDEVAIYAGLLTADEVAGWEYNGGAGRSAQERDLVSPSPFRLTFTLVGTIREE
jgi:hypothetical protein